MSSTTCFGVAVQFWRDALRDAGALEVVPDDVSDAGGAPSPADCWGGISGSPGPSDGRPVIGTQDLTGSFTDSRTWSLFLSEPFNPVQPDTFFIGAMQDNAARRSPVFMPLAMPSIAATTEPAAGGGE
ncbi:hypothetical protein VTK56DRAFT_9230 [Thermocarpiscus australiensis]